jgi:hypothetical protein
MSDNARVFSCLALTLAVLSGCSSQPAANQSKKGAALDRVQGKAQFLAESSGAADASMNAGGPPVYLVDGLRRYRLFLRAPFEVIQGKEYLAEGIYAQKAIDEIGDPDMGKNGYPLQDSCERVVRMAWNNLSFDAIESTGSVVRTRVKRYPARPLFLVTRIQQVTEGAAASGEPKKDATAADENIPEVTVAADKQSAFLIEGPTVLTAPLWDPAGETVRCKLIINAEGKIAALETGIQLCESVPWSQFRYQPPMKGGHPVKVHTEVEVRFEPRQVKP